MTFQSCRLGFSCDCCGDEIVIYVDNDLENISSIQGLAEYYFDQLASNESIASPAKLTDGHACPSCTIRSGLWWESDAVTVQRVKQLIEEKDADETDDVGPDSTGDAESSVEAGELHEG